MSFFAILAILLSRLCLPVRQADVNIFLLLGQLHGAPHTFRSGHILNPSTHYIFTTFASYANDH